MKFYGNGIVWDKEKNKELCRFVAGMLETENKVIIDLLKDKYEHDAEIEIQPKIKGGGKR